jgi:hypothetical protein
VRVNDAENIRHGGVAPARMSRFLILEVLIFLLPTTFFYIVMAGMAVGAAEKWRDQLFFAVLFGIIGYALFSVWCLVVRHGVYARLKHIPKWLWGGLIAGALLMLFIVLWMGFTALASPMSLPKILGVMVFVAILAGVCTLPFWLPRKAFVWGRGLLWLIFLLPIGLQLSGGGERFLGFALTSTLLVLAFGPLILSAIVLAIIRHRASAALEHTALNQQTEMGGRMTLTEHNLQLQTSLMQELNKSYANIGHSGWDRYLLRAAINKQSDIVKSMQLDQPTEREHLRVLRLLLVALMSCGTEDIPEAGMPTRVQYYRMLSGIESMIAVLPEPLAVLWSAEFQAAQTGDEKLLLEVQKHHDSVVFI